MRPRIQPYRQPREDPRGVGEGLPAAAVPRTSSAATIRRTGRSTRRSCPTLQEAAERAVAGGSERAEPAGARGGARRDRSAHRRHPGDGRRRETTRAARSTARRAAGGSRDRRSSRSSTRRRWRTAIRRCRCCRTCDSVTAPGDPEWSPRNAEGEQPDAADAARGAARIEQRRRPRICSSRSARAPSCGSRTTPGSSGLPDVPSLALGTGLVSPLDLTAAFTMFPGGGEVVRAARHRRRARRRTATQVFERPVERERVIEPSGRVSDGHHAARRHRSRHRIAGPRARRARPGRREDRHDRRLSRRLVRRLFDRRSSSASGSASISRRRSAATRTARASRCRSGPTS